MTVLRTNDAEGTREAGKALGLRLGAGSVVGLEGPLGAGKTVFVQGVAEALGIDGPVTSPTYTLICEYEGRMPLYHMDLYRLGTPEEFAWLGIEEMIDGDGVCLVEWADRAGDVLPVRTLRVSVAILADGGREIRIVDPAEEAPT